MQLKNDKLSTQMEITGKMSGAKAFTQHSQPNAKQKFNSIDVGFEE
jgi:hypothetical protein